jgi:hypothetical protein
MGPVSYEGFVTGMGEEDEGRAAQCRASRCDSAIVLSAQGSLMPFTTKIADALVAEAERMASSGSSPRRGASLKAPTQTLRRSKRKIRGRAQGAA